MSLLFDVVQVGAVHNGKQSITFPDSKTGTYRTVCTTPEKVDEFLTERKNIENKANKCAWIALGALTFAGALIGGAGKFAKDASRLENAAICAFLGAASSLIPTLGFAIKQDGDARKLTQQFIADNTAEETQAA